MKTCFLCRNEYDETNKERFILISNSDGHEYPIWQINKDGYILQLCSNCVKATVYGAQITDSMHFGFHMKDIVPKYEQKLENCSDELDEKLERTIHRSEKILWLIENCIEQEDSIKRK